MHFAWISVLCFTCSLFRLLLIARGSWIINIYYAAVLFRLLPKRRDACERGFLHCPGHYPVKSTWSINNTKGYASCTQPGQLKRAVHRFLKMYPNTTTYPVILRVRSFCAPMNFLVFTFQLKSWKFSFFKSLTSAKPFRLPQTFNNEQSSFPKYRHFERLRHYFSSDCARLPGRPPLRNHSNPY